MTQYEFSSSENRVVQALVVQMGRFAWTVIASGLFLLISTVLGILYLEATFSPFVNTVLVVDSIVILVLGIVWLQPINEFKAIVATEGEDITLLMKGLTELQKGFLWIAILTAVDLVFLMIRVGSQFMS